MKSNSELASIYHSKICRIPNPTSKILPEKRLLSEEEIQKLFTGVVTIQEKVDGKFSFQDFQNPPVESVPHKYKFVQLYEDLTGKNTVHIHKIQYNRPPYSKRVMLDTILEIEGYEPYFIPSTDTKLNISTMEFKVAPSIPEIYELLFKLSNRRSVFGDTKIEGLVIKNFGGIEKVKPYKIVLKPNFHQFNQLFGKFINKEFEDVLHK